MEWIFSKKNLSVFSILFVILTFAERIQGNDETLTFYHYTNEDGLPSSYVKSIVQDTSGFIWLATRITVSRFDGKDFQEFPVFDEAGNTIKIFCNKLFLSPDSILITRTNNGIYYYFDDDQECFRPYSLLNKMGTLDAVAATLKGYWICQNKKVVFLNLRTGKKEALKQHFPFAGIPEKVKFKNLMIRDKLLALLTDQGTIYCIDNHLQKAVNYKVPDEILSSSTDLQFIDSGNYIWIGELDHGLIRMNAGNGGYDFFSKEKAPPFHLQHNMVHCLTEDHKGRIWIGTEAGVARYSPETGHLSLSNFNLSDLSGLNSDPIYDVFCDKQGNVWLGTYFGGVNFWSSEKKFFRTWSSGLGRWQLRGNVVSCLAEDEKGNLWVGLEDKGLDKIDMKNGHVRHYAEGNGPEDLSYNNLHNLLFVSSNELWAATYTGGINIINTKTNRIRRLNRANTPALASDAIYAFMRVGDSVFIGTSAGITIHDTRKKTFTRFKPAIIGDLQFETMAKTKKSLWFSSGHHVYCYWPEKDSLFVFDKIPKMANINFVKTDMEGQIWIGDCYKGLCRYNEKDESVRYFNTDTGFPASWIFSLEEGENGWFWASSDKGLIKFSTDEKTEILYDSNSGIPFNQFNFRSSFKDKNRNIYFGGNNGMVSFNEKTYSGKNKTMNIMFTGMQLFNKTVHPGDYDFLKHSLNKVSEISLDYNQNVFTLEYTAFCFSSKGRCQYAYYLEGFESEWNYVGNRNFATYTNLSPGTYKFHVKGALDNIRKETKERTLTIIVRPPFWLTKWAFACYSILSVLFSVLVFKVGKNLEKSKSMIKLERREKEHANEIHKVKLEFFTNISHELKTPLTLILGPLNRTMQEEPLSPALRRRLMGIERNANRLFQLINQLLEFRKIENRKENLKITKCNIRTMMEEIGNSFENIIESRDIDFRVHYPQKDIPVWIDPGKVDKIIFNLLSNAFKFTKEGGKIEFSAELKKRDNKSGKSDDDLLISVSDSGKGIRPEMIDKVFDRFFQIDDDHSGNTGSGIGLAFVKSLVLLHKGEINVESIVNKGSVFTVKLPVSKTDYSAEEIISEPLQYWPSSGEFLSGPDDREEIDPIKEDTPSRKPSLLLVEDNIELINFMKETLELKYKVVTALNGETALKKLSTFHPDLIISDIMMPEMDGFAFTRYVKNNLETSHIPLILLTSKSGTENRLKGLKTGADYYIEKPFYPSILEQNISNILNTRKNLIERFKDDAFIQVGEMAHSESDKAFIEKITGIIKENISNSSMDVSFLVQKMGVSRSLLHMKLKGLVGCSSTEFIRAIRLKEAVRLIASGKCNISEAAYETGFSSPTYFTRRFHEFYGKSPREYFSS